MLPYRMRAVRAPDSQYGWDVTLCVGGAHAVGLSQGPHAELMSLLQPLRQAAESTVEQTRRAAGADEVRTAEMAGMPDAFFIAELNSTYAAWKR